MKKGLFIILVGLVCMVVLEPLLYVILRPFRASYVEREVSFRFSQNPECVYRFDRYSEGKDYDKLIIYEIKSDTEHFKEHLYRENWNLLPLTDEVLNHPLCSRSFDAHMDEMLSCTNGYWCWNDKFYKLIIYDIDTNRVYIRRASVLVSPGK